MPKARNTHVDPTPGTALITGAGRRIGRAIARELAGRGWAVAVHHNASADDALSLVEEIVAAGGRAAPVAADLACQEDVASLVDRAADVLGPVRCLVNNASLFECDTVESVTPESWERHMTVNLRAPFFLTQAFAKALPADGVGNVINILDQRVWNLTPYFISYTLSKSGLWTLTRTLAMALAPRIRVNGIGPGPILPSVHQTEEQFRRQWETQPLRRPIAPEEIARAVAFILDAPSMTGQMIALDGGQHLGWAQPARDGITDE
jgi:NAD(P)-dependent dehydrogenase (short-subunit alcohol dehydrogenase family)